jgi:hypothetical protein
MSLRMTLGGGTRSGQRRKIRSTTLFGRAWLLPNEQER